jgi:xanthine dehydrogenase large subunit
MDLKDLPLPAAADATPVVGASLPHESARLHVTGRAAYTDDLPEPAGTLHAALGLSPLAHGRIEGLDLARLTALPGVVAVFTAADIPGENNVGPIVHDDPILARDTVSYLGQPVFAVIARTRTPPAAPPPWPRRCCSSARCRPSWTCGPPTPPASMWCRRCT